ncbi:MAG: ATP-dependent DNA helicase RecG [Spirochaetes bacterium RBG_13_68_11]|nr:MAG: ATP-dependent DNA helicase RecG [Spirochaetes bacterium RBG_13_68_11]
MFLAELGQRVTELKGVGPVLAAHLARLGISTVRDLLLHLPRDCEDRRVPVPLEAAAGAGGKSFVEVTVVSLDHVGRGWRATPRAIVTDGESEAALLCFGRSFLGRVLQPDRRFRVWGTFKPGRLGPESSDFELESASVPAAAFGRLLPVYPLTEGLGQGAVRRAVRAALDQALPSLEDALPAGLRAAHGMPTTAAALRAVHAPADPAEAEAGRRALAWEELFWFELSLMRRRLPRTATREPRRINSGLRDAALGRLPFKLTADQAAVLAEIEADLGASWPMARLLQGDVGSGKTLVALLSALLVTASGGQVAFAAPTELLARQHAEIAARLLEPIGVRVAFLSGTVAGEPRQLLLAALATGEIDILFGTHALFSRDVAFRRLGLVVVDEQHKFGVRQRMAMLAKGEAPDLLLMTATPIPRTLAITAFGDLDVSTIRTMPPGRLPVVTHLARQANAGKVYRRVREELDRGRQAYFVYPLIGGPESGDGSEASSGPALKDAESAVRRLRDEIYPGVEVALIHSRVPEEEKVRAMAGFAAGRVKVLAATSVVEVGVDVANAACMVVEHAERFGLSTLHQLRGRVGRGTAQSYAFLVYGDDLTPEGVERLKIMKETTDGFRIAERDLALRGPGELLGVRQSGFLRFRVADLARDADLLASARDEARRILTEDPGFLRPENSPIGRVLAGSSPFPDAVLEGG